MNQMLENIQMFKLQSSEFAIKHDNFHKNCGDCEIVNFHQFVKQVEMKSISTRNCADKCVSTVEDILQQNNQLHENNRKGQMYLYLDVDHDNEGASTDIKSGEELTDAHQEVHEISSVDSEDWSVASIKPCENGKSQRRRQVMLNTAKVGSLEDHYNFIPDSEKQAFESTWNKRKVVLEQAAEVRALSTFHANQRESRSLEQVIDLSLKEYAEMHEKAHTVRLQFEAEKSEWAKKIRQDMSDEMETRRDASSRARGGNRGSSKMWKANEECDDVISAFRHQQLEEEQSLDFQYFSQPQMETLEVASPDAATRREDASSDLVSSVATGGTDRPNKRKFNVPVKQQ